MSKEPNEFTKKAAEAIISDRGDATPYINKLSKIGTIVLAKYKVPHHVREDILQDSFIKLITIWQKKGVGHIEDVCGYFRIIVRSKTVDWYNSSGTPPPPNVANLFPDSDETISSIDTPQSLPDSAANGESALNRFVTTLSITDKTLFKLAMQHIVESNTGWKEILRTWPRNVSLGLKKVTGKKDTEKIVSATLLTPADEIDVDGTLKFHCAFDPPRPAGDQTRFYAPYEQIRNNLKSKFSYLKSKFRTNVIYEQMKPSEQKLYLLGKKYKRNWSLVRKAWPINLRYPGQNIRDHIPNDKTLVHEFQRLVDLFK